MDPRTTLPAVCMLAACIGSAAADTLHVTSRDVAATAVVALARPAAIAFEQRSREHSIAGDDILFYGSLDVGALPVVAYRNRHVVDAGPSWCWVDTAHRRASCHDSGSLVLAQVLRTLAPATPTDADLAVLVSTLVSDHAAASGAHVDRRRDGVRIDYTLDSFDEARSKPLRVAQHVRITSAGDVVVAADHDNHGDVPARAALSFEGNRIGKGYVTPATLDPLRARSADFAACFADERDAYPVVGIDISLDAHDRVDVLAAGGTRVSIDTTACVAALVRSTQFDRRADRNARLSISRHAP